MTTAKQTQNTEEKNNGIKAYLCKNNHQITKEDSKNERKEQRNYWTSKKEKKKRKELNEYNPYLSITLHTMN